VTLRQVRSDEEARAVGFAGSPTILVDGRDLFPGAPTPDMLTCRIYLAPDGPAGSPTVEDIASALKERDSS
jgi:hypothetical protein